MDPIANMLIMMKNASLAGKGVVIVPHSKIKEGILECLKNEGYVGKFSKKARKDHPVLEIELLYTDKHPRITDVERISKGSRRVYYGMRDIYPILSGTGILVLSTPKGILSGKDAKKNQVGGEALFKLW